MCKLYSPMCAVPGCEELHRSDVCPVGVQICPRRGNGCPKVMVLFRKGLCLVHNQDQSNFGIPDEGIPDDLDWSEGNHLRPILAGFELYQRVLAEEAGRGQGGQVPVAGMAPQEIVQHQEPQPPPYDHPTGEYDYDDGGQGGTYHPLGRDAGDRPPPYQPPQPPPGYQEFPPGVAAPHLPPLAPPGRIRFAGDRDLDLAGSIILDPTQIVPWGIRELPPGFMIPPPPHPLYHTGGQVVRGVYPVKPGDYPRNRTGLEFDRANHESRLLALELRLGLGFGTMYEIGHVPRPVDPRHPPVVWSMLRSGYIFPDAHDAENVASAMRLRGEP